LGNGPSGWWATRESISPLRFRIPDLVVVACNRTGPRIGADLTVAVDRAIVEAILFEDVWFGGLIAGLRSVVDAVAHERLQPHQAEQRLVSLDDDPEGTGSGLAAFRAIVAAGAGAVVLSGFDGSADPRTRCQGQSGYRTMPGNPALLDHWNRAIEAQAALALAGGAIGAYAGPSGVLRLSPVAALPDARVREARDLAFIVGDLARPSQREGAPCPS
jgi:hypothetical protein